MGRPTYADEKLPTYLPKVQPTIQNLSKILLFEKSESSISKAV